MAKERNALKAGSFMVVTAVLAVLIVVGIEGWSHFTQKTAEQKVRFALSDDIGGLKAGDEVRAGGFKIGQITSIDLVGLEAGTPAGTQPGVVITYSIPEKYVVHKDAQLTVQTTVTGQSCLNFKSFGAGTALAMNEELAGKPSAIAQLFNDLEDSGDLIKATLVNANGAVADVRTRTLPLLNQTLAKYGDTSDSATTLVNDVHGKLPFILDKYAAVADSAVRMMQKTGDFFGDSSTDFRGTLANLHTISGNINESLPGMLKRIDGILAKLDTTMQGAATAMEDVKTITANTKDVSQSVREIITGNRGKIDGMIASLKAASDNLKNTTAEVRRSPWRLLYKPAPNEMANLNLFDAARAFADGANDLNDAATALRDAVQSKQVDPATVQKMMDQVDKSFTNFQNVQAKLVQQVKE